MKVPPFTFRQLTYFAAAARHGKIAAAATDVGISQSAVTNAILFLEELFGVALFERHASGVRLTHQGRILHERVEDIIASADISAIHSLITDENIRGSVKVALSEVVSGYFILPLLARFRKRFPDVKVELIERSRQECERLVRADEVDLGVILSSNTENTDELDVISLAKSERHVWVSAGSDLLQNKSLSVEELSMQPFIQLQLDEGEKVVSHYFAQFGLQPNLIFKTRAMEALREAVAIGTGITIVADFVYRPWSLDGRKIERIALANPMPTLEIGVVSRKTRALTPSARAFQKFLADQNSQATLG